MGVHFLKQYEELNNHKLTEETYNDNCITRQLKSTILTSILRPIEDPAPIHNYIQNELRQDNQPTEPQNELRRDSFHTEPEIIQNNNMWQNQSYIQNELRQESHPTEPQVIQNYNMWENRRYIQNEFYSDPHHILYPSGDDELDIATFANENSSQSSTISSDDDQYDDFFCHNTPKGEKCSKIRDRSSSNVSTCSSFSSSSRKIELPFQNFGPIGINSKMNKLNDKNGLMQRDLYHQNYSRYPSTVSSACCSPGPIINFFSTLNQHEDNEHSQERIIEEDNSFHSLNENLNNLYLNLVKDADNNSNVLSSTLINENDHYSNQELSDVSIFRTEAFFNRNLSRSRISDRSNLQAEIEISNPKRAIIKKQNSEECSRIDSSYASLTIDERSSDAFCSVSSAISQYNFVQSRNELSRQFRPFKKQNKKRSEALDEAVYKEFIEKKNKNKHCSFCFNSGEDQEFYTSHSLKDVFNRNECPVLRAIKCKVCGATGDEGHTLHYCPKFIRQQREKQFGIKKSNTPKSGQ